jgi:membrane protease YdiL (CAAX protease family)
MNQNPGSVYPSLPQAWGIFGVFLAFTIAIGLLFGNLLPLIGIENMSIINFIGYNLSMLFIIWFAWRFKSSSTTEKPFLFFNRIPAVLYPIILLLTLSLGVFLDPITSLIPMPEYIEKLFAMLTARDLWTFIMVGITGPILEEVLFRGIILDGFLNRYRPGKAIFWSAFLFGLFHLNPWQFIPGFLIGLLLGYVYLKTRSIIPVILIHIINNSFSYLVIYFYDEDVISFRDLFTETRSYMIFFGISSLIFFLCLVWLTSVIRHRMLFQTETASNNNHGSSNKG